MNVANEFDPFIRPEVGRLSERAGVPADREGMGFEDLLDVINPLQHLPIVRTIYRRLTGDEISGPARVAGGFLFGGPIGMVAGMASAAAVEATGSDLGETLVGILLGDESSPPAETEAANEGPNPARATGEETGEGPGENPEQVSASASMASIPFAEPRPVEAHIPPGDFRRIDRSFFTGPRPATPRAEPNGAEVPVAEGSLAPDFTERMLDALVKLQALSRGEAAAFGSERPARPANRN
jgi:hypothetical protein